MGKEKKCCCFRRPKFLNELFQKLKSRRGEEDDDPGLPSSPVTQPSKHDVLNDFKKPKRHESKHSVTSDMNSSDDELEEKDVFRVNWTEVVGNGKGVTTDTDNSGELDLDLVNSTTSLSNMGARHKISVRPQRTRPSAQHRRPVKAPVAGAAMKALPQVQEEQASRVVEEVKEEEEEEEKEVEKEEEQTGRLSRSEDVSLDAEAEPKVELRVEASVEPEIEPKRSSDLDKDEEEAVVPSDEAHPEAPVSLVIPKPELRSSPVPAPKSPKPQDRKTPEPEKKEVLIVEAEQTDIETKEREKKEVEQEKTEIKPPLQDESREATPFKVVLRDTGRRKNIEEAGTLRRRDNIVDKDPTKRQTIAGDASLAIFGERKPGNRSSFVEVRHSQEVKEEAENEFSQVLNRLKKQSSRRKLIPGSASDAVTDSEQPKPTAAAVVDPKPKLAEVTHRPVEAKPKVAEAKPKVMEVKPKVSEAKPKVPEAKSKVTEVKPKVIDSKPKVTEVKPKVTEFKPKVTEAKPSETISKSVNASRLEKEGVVKGKETVIITSTPVVSKRKETDIRSVKIQPKVEETRPLSNLDTKSESKRETEPKLESKPQAQPEVKPQATSAPKTMIIEKPKLQVEPKKTVIIEKIPASKTPTKEEAGNSDESQQFKRESPLQKNRLRSQTLGDQPVSDSANKENETSAQLIRRSNSHGDTVEESESATKLVTRNASKKVPASEGGGGSEPAWFALARRKTTNWECKEKELEQKEKKETSNIAEKERDAEKSKEVSLTIDDAAKEDSKPALRAVGKCSNSAASRQSKVLDMAKLFQNQVS